MNSADFCNKIFKKKTNIRSNTFHKWIGVIHVEFETGKKNIELVSMKSAGRVAKLVHVANSPTNPTYYFKRSEHRVGSFRKRGQFF